MRHYGLVELFRGAFVHAERPDWGVHFYGVVVTMTPKKIDLSAPGSHWTERIEVAKHDVRLLDAIEWQIVEEELRRRRLEYDEAERRGKTGALPDYSAMPIRLGQS